MIGAHKTKDSAAAAQANQADFARHYFAPPMTAKEKTNQRQQVALHKAQQRKESVSYQFTPRLLLN